MLPPLFLKVLFENTAAVVDNCRTLHLQKSCEEASVKSRKRERNGGQIAECAIKL